MQVAMVLQVLKDFFSNRWVQIALGLLAISLLGWWIYNKLVGNNPEDKELPNSGKGIPEGWKPDGIAQELYDVLDGLWTSPSDKGVVIGKLMALTDDQLTAVYNKFGDMFAKEKDGTMYEWIQDEQLIDGPVDILLDRMRGLNLI